MTIVSRLGLTRNEGLYLVFVEAHIYDRAGDITAIKRLDTTEIRDSWAVKGVGYNVQSLIRDVALECLRDGSEAVEARTEYLDRIRRQVRLERESFRDAVRG